MLKRCSMFVGAVLAPVFVLAADEPDSSSHKWLPAVQLETDIGIGHNSRDIGLPQMAIPLWQDDKSLLFSNLRYRFDNEQSQEYNLGLGFRREITPDWILGGYGFFDKLSSANGNLYTQGTFGVEAIRVNNDAHFNFYVPQNTVHGVAGGGQVQIIGNQLSIAGGSERALPGWDFELGQKLPVSFADVRIYGGAYHYGADNFGAEAGPRGRLEVTLNDHYISTIPFNSEITLGAEIEHDEIRGTQGFGILKLRIPLGTSGVRKTTDTLDERMNTFIQRDVDIIEKRGGAAEVGEINGNVVTNVVQLDWTSNFSTAVNNASAGTLFLVNSTGGFVNGNNDVVTMKSGQTILGGGTTISVTGVNSGRTINYTTPNSQGGISGVGSLAELNMADNTLMQGIALSHAPTGLNINNANNVTLNQNQFFQTPVTIQGSNHVTFYDNSVRSVNPAISISGAPSANLRFISDTFPSDIGDAIVVLSNVNNLAISGNNLTNSGNGLTFTNVTITGLNGSGNIFSPTGSNCTVTTSTISGSVVYNGGSTCP